MKFESLKEKYLYYRNITDYKLCPNSYIMIMLDGRTFSKKIKKCFEVPFDKKFIEMMNQTAIYLCENVSNCIITYAQSDEITLVLSDIENKEPFFGNRLCKLQSVIASMATSKFNQLMLINDIENIPCSKEDVTDIIKTHTLYEFDCKAWNLPSVDDVVASILYRQNDCVRNSKQMVAQHYFSRKELEGKKTDEQIQMVKDKFNVDWNVDFSNGEKYGRFIKHFQITFMNENGERFGRNTWVAKEAEPLTEDVNRAILKLDIEHP
jgi:tRNA(His) guanylyltransferase